MNWYTISVAGVNADLNSQANLWKLMQDVQANPDQKVTATIVPERDNPHDPNALRVELNGQKIGYVARKDQPGLVQAFPAFPATVAALKGKIEGWGVHKDNQLFCQINIPVTA
jgi:hypothetical protein